MDRPRLSSPRAGAARCPRFGRGALAGVMAAAAAAGSSPAEPAAVDVLLGNTRTTRALAPLAASASGSLAADEPARVRELGRDTDTSHHLVTLRNREPLHRHDRHAITVLVLEGDGAMHIDGEERPVGKGSLIYVPRGAVHAFINHSEQPAVAYVLYSPPYDGTDRQLVTAPTAAKATPRR